MPSIIEALVREHSEFRAVFHEIQKALADLSLPQIKGIARNIETLLLSHAAAEDDLVLLAQARLLPDKKKRRYERIRKEHLEIDGQLTQLHTQEDIEGARSLLKAVIAYSEHHFLHEERIIFPRIEQVLDPETLDRLGNLWLLRREGSLGRPVPEEASILSMDALLSSGRSQAVGRVSAH